MPLTTHPDWEKFHQIGPPENIISRRPQGELMDEDENAHYAKSQTSFAHQSQSKLIELSKQFKLGEIFDGDATQVSPDEIARMEHFYRQITQDRIDIFCSTRASHDDAFWAGMARTLLEITSIEIEDSETDISKATKAIKAISYKDSHLQKGTATDFSHEECRYAKYRQEGIFFDLSSVVKLLDVEPREIDSAINLGYLRETQEGGIEHAMGCYRISEDEERINRINRVDDITALAAKKAFAATDLDEILKYSLIFAALRGYNVRSNGGACWVQEMSLRWILDQKNLLQCRKGDGIYWDVEMASSRLFAGEGAEHFELVINAMIADYKSPQPSIFFDKPLVFAEQNQDFIRHLIETKKYRQEDLAEIVEYEGALEVAASLGDRDFFLMLQDNAELLNEKNIDWYAIGKNAEEYGDEELVKIIEEFRHYEVELDTDSIDWDFIVGRCEEYEEQRDSSELDLPNSITEVREGEAVVNKSFVQDL